MDARGQSSVLSWGGPLSPGNCSNACRYFLLSPLETVLFYLVNRSQMFSNIPQHTSQLPNTKNYLIPNVNSPCWEKLGKREPYLKSSYYIISLERTQLLPWMTRLYLGDCQNLQCKLPLRIQIERQGLNSCHFWQNASSEMFQVRSGVGLVPALKL